MTRLFINIIFCLISITAFSQAKSWEEVLIFLDGENLKLKNVIRQAQNFEIHDTTNIYSGTIIKHLDDHTNLLFEHYYASWLVVAKTHKTEPVQYYNLQLISCRKNIISVIISKLNNDTIIHSIQNDDYHFFTEDFANWINDIPDTSHKYYSPNYEYLIGFACSDGGQPTRIVEEMMTLVAQNDTNELYNWCHSLNPEIRCTGASGLEKIKRKGIKLSLNLEAIRQKISTHRTDVYTCSGCTEWWMPKSNAQIYMELVEY